MTLLEALKICGNRYKQYIQLGWADGRKKGERSGIMQKGNITYTKLDKYGYGYEVKYIFPKFAQGKEILFLQLWEKKQ